MRMRPPLISSSPANMRSAVVLPQPDGPTSTRNSPSATSMLRSSTATASSKRFVRCSNVIVAISALLRQREVCDGDERIRDGEREERHDAGPNPNRVHEEEREAEQEGRARPPRSDRGRVARSQPQRTLRLGDRDDGDHREIHPEPEPEVEREKDKRPAEAEPPVEAEGE